MLSKWTLFVDYDDRVPAPTFELESTNGVRANRISIDIGTIWFYNFRSME